MGILFGRRRRSEGEVLAEHLHDDLVALIRAPAFYLKAGVPDTFEGRFDLLVLYASLLLRRLQALGPSGQDVAQPFVDLMFRRFDIAMRELGVSDIGVPKKMKRLAEAFKGRCASYDAAMDAQDEADFATAVARNVLDGRGDVTPLARHALGFAAGLASLNLADIRHGLAFQGASLDV